MALTTEKNFFGLDIGTTGVRIVQLKPSGGKPSLVSYASVEMPKGLFQSDSAPDRNNLSNIVRELVKNSKIGTNKVVAALPGSRIYSTVVKVPKLTASELATAIKYQAEQYLPLGLDEVKLDWTVLPQDKDSKANEMEVLIVAAPIGIVEKYTEVLTGAGLDILAFEINPLAAARALVAVGAGTVAVVDIGALNSDIAIVHNNVVYLTRSVQTAGEAFTRSVAKSLGLDEAQAEQFKKKFGLTQEKLEGQVYKAIRPIIDSILQEVKRSIEFFEEQKPGVKVQKVILAGQSAMLPELTVYATNTLNLESEIGNAWSQISFHADYGQKLQEVNLEFAVAAGLAMRGLI